MSEWLQFGQLNHVSFLSDEINETVIPTAKNVCLSQTSFHRKGPVDKSVNIKQFVLFVIIDTTNAVDVKM